MPGVKHPDMTDQRPDEATEYLHRSLEGLATVEVRLSWLCDAFRAQSGIDCRLEVSAEHARLDPAAGEVLYRTIRELFALYKRAQTRRILVTSEPREDGSVAFHVSLGTDAPEPRSSPLEGDAVALWDIDQRLREVGAYLELENEPSVCTSVVFPRELVALS